MTLEIKLANPLRHVGSAASDIWGCLRKGGIAQLKEHVNLIAEQRHYGEEKQLAILDELAVKYRLELAEAESLINQSKNEMAVLLQAKPKGTSQ